MIISGTESRLKSRVRSDDTEEESVPLLELLSPWKVKAYCPTPGVAPVLLKKAVWGQPPCTSPLMGKYQQSTYYITTK